MAREPAGCGGGHIGQYAFNVAHHLFVGETNDKKSVLGKLAIAQPVLPCIVRVAIDLDDQGSRRTHEIDDKTTDYLLPTKLQAIELPVRKITP